MPKSNKHILLIILGGFAGIVALFGLSVAVLSFSGGNRRSNTDRWAVIFVTDFIQSDKKEKSVFFINNQQTTDPAFQDKINQLKALVRDGNYMTEPTQVGSLVTTPPLSRSKYKICKPATSDCLIISVTVMSHRYVQNFEYSL